jgi:toxin ParE1/3/4
MKYKISVRGLIDLDEIWLYTFEEWSIEQADIYINSILDKIEFLSNNPFQGDDYSNIKNGYYKSKINSHYIFYKVNSIENKIEVIRVLHEVRDIKSHLPKY